MVTPLKLGKEYRSKQLRKTYSELSRRVTILVWKHEENTCQAQLRVMNGALQCYRFRFKRNHHQAVQTKTFKTRQFYMFCTKI